MIKNFSDRMEAKHSTTIASLPPEIFNIIAQYLSSKDIQACDNVSKQWRDYFFNSNEIWNKCCNIPKKYLIKYRERALKETKDEVFLNSCDSKQYYKLEKHLYRSWSKGQLIQKVTPIGRGGRYTEYVKVFCDEFGNYWLFEEKEHGINFWNLNEIDSDSGMQMTLFGDRVCGLIRNKLLTFDLKNNTFGVSLFENPDYQLKPLYSFRFDDDIFRNLSSGPNPFQQVSSNPSLTYSDYILVDSIFIGYFENVTDDSTSLVHIWDLESAMKIEVIDMLDCYFKYFINSWKGANASENFKGSLKLSGDSRQFLVNIIDDRFKLCQISLFCLDKMAISGAIEQLEDCKSAWCEMKNNMIVVWHSKERCTSSQISVYNINGEPILYYEYMSSSNPFDMGNQGVFYFSGTELIGTLGSMICVWSFSHNEVINHCFKVDGYSFIVSTLFQKFVLLITIREGFLEYNESVYQTQVWDMEKGRKIWTRNNFDNLDLVFPSRSEGCKYPGKLIFRRFEDDKLMQYDFENVF